MNQLTSIKTARQQVAKAIRDLSGATIKTHEEKTWASITFRGSRHKLDLVFEGQDAVERADVFTVLLPVHQFAFDGYLVADAYVSEHHGTEGRAIVKIELLLLEEQPQ